MLLKEIFKLRYTYIVLFVSIYFSTGLHAQVEDNRKSEATIKIEDRFMVAKLLVAGGKKAEAIKLLDTLRRESAPSAAIFFELSKLHYENKDLNQTESNLREAVKLEPDNIWIRQFEVNFSKELGRYDEAIVVLNYLSALQPKNEYYYDQIVPLQIKKNDLTGALLTLGKKEKNVGWSVNTTLKKAEILDNADRLNDAVSMINTLVHKYPKEKKYLRLIANMLHSNDKIAEAEPYLKKILDIDPNDNDSRLGLLLMSRGKISKEDYLITLSPLMSNPDAPLDMKIKELLTHVRQHAETGDTVLGKQLIDLCDKLVIAHPNEAKSHAIYGDVLKNNDQTTAAIRQYEKTLTLNNKNFVVWEQLMYCLDGVENYDQLLATSSDAIDLFPNQAISYYFSAKSWIVKNDLKKATGFLDEASMISSGNPNVDSRILTARAKIAFKNKEWNKAMELTDQALVISQHKNADAMELKGDIYKETNDLKNAAMSWLKAKEMGGKSPRLMNKTDALKNN
jgi:tetratricopeptide (TPR) repeat protein